MQINKTNNNNDIVIALNGRLDTTTCPLLENELINIESYSSLTFDFNDLEYISSAGLRIILNSYKILKDKFKIINIKESVKEILDITGFSSFLNLG